MIAALMKYAQGVSAKLRQDRSAGLSTHRQGEAPRGIRSRPVIMPRLVVLVLLIGSIFVDGSEHHSLLHWVLLAGYVAATAFIAVDEFKRSKVRRWISPALDGILAGYLLSEPLLAASNHDRMALDAINHLAGLLLLLTSAIDLRVRQAVCFLVIVTVLWSASIAFSHYTGRIEMPALRQQLYGIVVFNAAGGFVLSAILRLRTSFEAAVNAERERSFLARFVPPGTSLSRFDGERGASVEPRHACLMAIDIRGFSQLSRKHAGDDVLRWLLNIRALTNEVIASEGGVVDKYVGDGVLAQFFEGAAADQAASAMRATLAIQERLTDLNRKRRAAGTPPIRLIVALHAGQVLAGVLDDGARAELTVLGPPMNVLSRIEREGKKKDDDIIMSWVFASHLHGIDFDSEDWTIEERERTSETPKLIAIRTNAVA